MERACAFFSLGEEHLRMQIKTQYDQETPVNFALEILCHLFNSPYMLAVMY